MSKRRDKGLGSVTQRKDGKWVARVELPPDLVTGQRRRVSRIADTKTGAQRKVAELLTQKNKTGDLATGSIRVGKYLEDWLKRKQTRIKPSTFHGYESKIRLHVIPVIGKKRLDRLTPSDVELIEDHFREADLSMSSARQTLTILSGALDDASRKGLIGRNPVDVAERPEATVGRRKPIPPEHVTQFIRANKDDLYLARFILALATSARQSEILGLELDRLRVDERWASFTKGLQRVTYSHGCGGVCGKGRASQCPRRRFIIPGKYEGEQVYGGLWLLTPKSETSKRPIPFGEFTAAVMRKYLEESKPDRFVFEMDGNPIDFRKDVYKWKEMLKRAGLPEHYQAYQLRHSTATMLKAKSVGDGDRQAFMGHSSIDMTEHYTHYDAERLLGAADALESSFREMLRA